MSTIEVRGGTLAGLAAAARLAKAGHQVVLSTQAAAVGARSDDLPQVFQLPAVWRDLLRKSGRDFTTEVTRHGLRLVEAPAAIHQFGDGLELSLPGDRAGQQIAITQALGDPAARRWTSLLDEADQLWQALRMTGLERPRPPLSRQHRADLWSRLTLADLAHRVQEPHLARVITSLGHRAGTDSRRAPALLISRMHVERTFARWQLADDAGPVAAARLIHVLVDRLSTRRVQVHSTDAEADVTLTAVPEIPAAGWPRRDLSPALAPQVDQQTRGTHPGDARHIIETVDHRREAPVVTWWRPLADGRSLAISHDYRHTSRDLGWGLEPDSFTSWTRRGGLRTAAGEWTASTSSAGGNEPWAEVLAAALAVYDLHEHLTGRDIRPTNRSAGVK